MALQILKILSDGNISPIVVSFLREKGINGIDVKEKGWQGVDDKFLMAGAWEEKRFILTHDSDFGTLAINEGVPCYGIIYIRVKDLRVEKVKDTLDKFIRIEKEISEGNDYRIEGQAVENPPDRAVNRKEFPRRLWYKFAIEGGFNESSEISSPRLIF